MIRKLVILLLCTSGAGCATYVTPSGGMSMAGISGSQEELATMTDQDLRAFYEREPVSPFPTNIAIVRVQDSGYVSHSYHGYGTGRYSIITTRSIEGEDAYETLTRLPMVEGVAPIGRILLPPNASTIKDLRMPAAKLRADMLLIYSVDTAFSVDGKSFGPMSVISLGFLRNKKAHVTATVAGVLVDVRTGFVYGTTEASAYEEQSASIWSTQLAIDTSRLKAEKRAFESFVGEFEGLWKGVVETHVGNRPDARRPVVMQEPEESDSYYRIQFDNE